MPDHVTKVGRCLCEAIQFHATLVGTGLTACHCGQCQRWTGGGPFHTVRVKDVTVKGADHIAAYRASDHGERAFCSNCGTTLYWRMQGKPISSLSPALFDDQSDMQVESEIFVDCRAPWQQPYAGAEQSTEAAQMQLLSEYLVKEAADK